MAIPNGKDNKRQQSLRLLSLIMNIGLTTALCILVGIGLGVLLDWLIGSSPLFIIIMTILGVAAAFKNIYDMSKKIH